MKLPEVLMQPSPSGPDQEHGLLVDSFSFPNRTGSSPAGERERMESREEERKGSGGAAATAAAARVTTPGMNLRNLVSREYYGHKKKVPSPRPLQYRKKRGP